MSQNEYLWSKGLKTEKMKIGKEVFCTPFPIFPSVIDPDEDDLVKHYGKIITNSIFPDNAFYRCCDKSGQFDNISCHAKMPLAWTSQNVVVLSQNSITEQKVILDYFNFLYPHR